MAGKGDKRRPSLVSTDQVAINWHQTFGAFEHVNPMCANDCGEELTECPGCLNYHCPECEPSPMIEGDPFCKHCFDDDPY